MTIDTCCGSSNATESPLACNLGAFTAAERPRYDALRHKVATAVIGKKDLPEGVALQIASDRVLLAEVAEWISFERKCCPFFDFRLDVARDSGPITLSLTGRAGVKEFLGQTFSS